MNLNYFKYCSLILLFSLGLMACEKVIVIDLNEADPKLIIEAVISDSSGIAKVLIGKTTGFYDTIQYIPVSGAAIKLVNSNGLTYMPKEKTIGNYVAESLDISSGLTYTLTVDYGGKTYTAIATMPTKVVLDSLSFNQEDRKGPGFGGGPPNGNNKKQYNVVYHFMDPLGVKNFYRVKLYVNDTLSAAGSPFRLLTDKVNDGKAMTRSLSDKSIVAGDKVRVELITLTADVFHYYDTLREILIDRRRISASPANPENNIQGGALGYFGVFPVSGLEVVVK